MSRAHRRGRWARRALALVALLLGAVLAGRIALPFLLPAIVDRLVAKQDLAVSWDDSQLVLRRGEVELDGLALSARGSPSEPLARIEHVRVDVGVLAALRGRFVVNRAYVDGLEVRLERLADGSRPLVDRLARFGSGSDEPRPAAKAPGPIDLGLPFELQAVGLQRLSVHWRDETMDPPLDVTLLGNAHLAHLGSRDRKAHLQATLSSEGGMDLILLTAEGIAAGRDAELDLSFEMNGLRPRAIAGLLARAGLEPDARRLDGSFRARARTTGSAAGDDALRVAVDIEDLTLMADDEPVVGIPSLRARASAISGRGLDGGVLELDGASLVASSSPAGLVVFGLGLAGAGPAPPAEPGPGADAEDDAGPGGWPLLVQSVAVRGASLTVHDRKLYPVVSHELRLDALDVRNLALWTAHPAGAASFDLEGRVTGMADAVSIAGTLEPDGTGRALTSTLRFEGLHPSALKERLAAANLQTSLESGAFECELFFRSREDGQGPASFSFGVEELSFSDRHPLLEIDRLALEDVVYDRTRSFLRVGNVELAGTRASATMDPEGNLSALGLRTLSDPGRETRTRARTLADAVNTLAAAVLPSREALRSLLNAVLPHEDVRFELGGLDWHDGSVALSDEGPLGEFGFEVSDLGAKVGAVVIDGRSQEEHAEAKVWLRSPGSFQEIALDGSVTYGLVPARLESRLELTAAGVEQAWLEPLLGSQGIEPTFGSGRLGVVVDTRLTAGDADVEIETSVTDLFFEGAAGRLAGIASITLEGAHYGDGGLDLGVIEVVGPELGVQRHADGRLELLGLRPIAPVAPEAAVVGGEAPGTDTAVGPAAQVPAPQPERAAAGAGSSVAIQRLAVKDGSIAWSDAQRGVDSKLGLAVELTDVTFGGDAAKGAYAIDLEADGQQHVRLDGSAEVGRGLHLTGALAADGISGDRLTPYLPPGVAFDLSSGLIALDFDAEARRAEAGGLAGKAAVKNLRIGESGSPPRASLGEARVELSRLDLEAGQILVDEVSVSGLDLSATLGADGATHLMGLAFSSPPPSAPGDPPVEAPADPPAPPARRGSRLDTVRLERLDFELARFELTDERRPGSAALELGARLTNKSPLDLLTPTSVEAETLSLELEGFAHPLVETIEVTCAFTPDIRNPTLSAEVAIGGIHGPALIELFPELEGRLDPASLVGGSLSLKLQGGLEYGLRGRHFGLAASADDIELRDGSGAVVGGFERVYVDAPMIDPDTGDVHVRSVGLIGPHGKAILRKGGVEVAGLVFQSGGSDPKAEASKVPDAPPAAASDATGAPAAPAEAAPAHAPVEAPAAAKPRKGELVVDEAIVSGVEVALVDETTDPPTTIPLEDLYVQLRGISSRAFEGSRPIRFEGYTSAGAAKVGDKQLRGATLEELAVEGWLELFPKPTGWIRINIAGLDLVPLRARAEKSDVRIKRGTLDSSIRATIKNNQLDVRSRTNFTDLEMSEKEGGPIQSTLKLPVPLNAAILLLENANGELIIPLSFTMRADQISRSQLFLTTTATLSQVLIAAIAKSPFRITNTAAQLVGLSERDKRKPPRVEEIQFAPGDATLESTQRKLVLELREVLAKGDSTIVMTHAMGTGDRDFVAQRATPSTQEATGLVELLRQRRREFSHEATLATARGRTRLAMGDEAGCEAATEEARTLLGEYERVGDALDDLGQLLRRDESEQVGYRQNRLMTELGWLRLDSVYGPLVEGLPPDVVANVILRRPMPRRVGESEGGVVEITVRKRK